MMEVILFWPKQGLQTEPGDPLSDLLMLAVAMPDRTAGIDLWWPHSIRYIAGTPSTSRRGAAPPSCCPTGKPA